MTIATHDARVDSIIRTDGTTSGCNASELLELTSELTNALDGAIWSFMLQAELEDAFDTALLRAAIAETPTLSRTELHTAA